MAAWRSEAARLIAELLGPGDVAWLPWAGPVPVAGGSRVAVSLVGCASTAEERSRVFGGLAAALASDSILVVVDHNRPRRIPAALWAIVASPWVPGWTPARRWRRLAQPTAREVQAAGLRVDCVRFAAGERVQVIVARRPA